MMGGGGMPGETVEEGVWIKISGGNIRLYGGVDVLDSNGIIEISGGTVIVDTPRLAVYGSPNGIIDANGETVITGGTFVCYAQSTGSVTRITKNPSLAVSSRLSAGAATEVKDAGGQVIYTDTVQNGGSVFFITSDLLKSGETYTVITGGSTQSTAAQ